MGLAQRRTQPRSRGRRDGCPCDPLDGAGHVVCRARDDRSVSPIQVQNDDGTVNREHPCARADLVDLPAALHLPQEIHVLTRRDPRPGSSHACRDVDRETSVFVPNDFLTRVGLRAATPRRFTAHDAAPGCQRLGA